MMAMVISRNVYLRWVGHCTRAGVVAGRCIGLGIQRLGDICAFAIPSEAPTVV